MKWSYKFIFKHQHIYVYDVTISPLSVAERKLKIICYMKWKYYTVKQTFHSQHFLMSWNIRGVTTPIYVIKRRKIRVHIWLGYQTHGKFGLFSAVNKKMSQDINWLFFAACLVSSPMPFVNLSNLATTVLISHIFSLNIMVLVNSPEIFCSHFVKCRGLYWKSNICLSEQSFFDFFISELYILRGFKL